MSIPPYRRVWYHGSRDAFDSFDPVKAGQSKDINTGFGFHFASREETAWIFATWLYRGRDEEKKGYLYACRLNIRKPLQVGYERDLAYRLLDFGERQGMLPQGLMQMQAAEFGVEEERLMTSLSSGVWGDFSRRLYLLGKGHGLVAAYLDHLRARGHDAIIYGNTHEKEVTRYGEPTAVVFDPERVEILERVPASVDVWHTWHHPAMLEATGRIKEAQVELADAAGL